MSLSILMSTASQGMAMETRRLSATASNIANISTSTSGQPVDLAAEMIDMVQAEIGFKANASVFETGADLWDVLMSIKRD
ncbi:flagellar basal body protein [Pararhizobium sp.]|uniref:flagellar basal body protein n=1 Tax=Pararhizobium sp. TaxID=1977563 RepID=UPI0027171CD9|nr:flagellar basal body rod C-terminal domain-containing protein [Pararhizobium sp.]MDO9416446.1 flagellar basal body rod C-terminal domain-containing protein [Pararhizobium sp.]